MSDKQYTVDAYVVDALMRDLVGHDHRASAFLVYLVLAASEEGARVSATPSLRNGPASPNAACRTPCCI